MTTHETLFKSLAERVAREPEHAVRIQTPPGVDLILLERTRYEDLLAKALAWDAIQRAQEPTRLDPDGFLGLLDG